MDGDEAAHLADGLVDVGAGALNRCSAVSALSQSSLVGELDHQEAEERVAAAVEGGPPIGVSGMREIAFGVSLTQRRAATGSSDPS